MALRLPAWCFPHLTAALGLRRSQAVLSEASPAWPRQHHRQSWQALMCWLGLLGRRGLAAGNPGTFSLAFKSALQSFFHTAFKSC